MTPFVLFEVSPAVLHHDVVFSAFTRYFLFSLRITDHKAPAETGRRTNQRVVSPSDAHLLLSVSVSASDSRAPLFCPPLSRTSIPRGRCLSIETGRLESSGPGWWRRMKALSMTPRVSVVDTSESSSVSPTPPQIILPFPERRLYGGHHLLCLYRLQPRATHLQGVQVGRGQWPVLSHPPPPRSNGTGRCCSRPATRSRWPASSTASLDVGRPTFSRSRSSR